MNNHVYMLPSPIDLLSKLRTYQKKCPSVVFSTTCTLVVVDGSSKRISSSCSPRCTFHSNRYLDKEDCMFLNSTLKGLVIKTVPILFCGTERNLTEHLVPQNIPTYFAERIEMDPKQLPNLVVII